MCMIVIKTPDHEVPEILSIVNYNGIILRETPDLSSHMLSFILCLPDIYFPRPPA